MLTVAVQQVNAATFISGPLPNRAVVRAHTCSMICNDNMKGWKLLHANKYTNHKTLEKYTETIAESNEITDKEEQTLKTPFE